MTELLTLFGATSNAATTGSVSFTADFLQAAVTAVRIPKGTALKIWSYRMNGAASAFKIQYTLDQTAGSPTWFTVDYADLETPGAVDLEKRRPVVLRGITGKEGIQVAWDQTLRNMVQAVTNFSMDVELGDEAEEQ